MKKKQKNGKIKNRKINIHKKSKNSKNIQGWKKILKFHHSPAVVHHRHRGSRPLSVSLPHPAAPALAAGPTHGPLPPAAGLFRPNPTRRSGGRRRARGGGGREMLFPVELLHCQAAAGAGACETGQEDGRGRGFYLIF